MPKTEHVWQREDQASLFLEEIRGGIPLAAEQIEIIRRIIRHTLGSVDRLLDMGCGDGILGRAIQNEHPAASAVFLDFSEHMIAAARRHADPGRSAFMTADYGDPGWTRLAVDHGPFDLVLSGFSIHHQTDDRKRELYGEIFALLVPGGLFLNLEHVSANADWATRVFRELFIDSLWASHCQRGGGKTRAEIQRDFESRPSRGADIPTSVEQQCDWLREIGFGDVDCFFKLFQLALFGGRKPQ